MEILKKVTKYFVARKNDFLDKTKNWFDFG